MAERLENDPYKRFFWILIAACIGVVFAGAGSFFMTKATVDQQTKILDEVRQDVRKMMETRYTGDQAAQDRASMQNAAALDRKSFMDSINTMTNAWTDLIKEQADINRMQATQITDLLMFKAKYEDREKPK